MATCSERASSAGSLSTTVARYSWPPPTGRPHPVEITPVKGSAVCSGRKSRIWSEAVQRCRLTFTRSPKRSTSEMAAPPRAADGLLSVPAFCEQAPSAMRPRAAKAAGMSRKRGMRGSMSVPPPLLAKPAPGRKPPLRESRALRAHAKLWQGPRAKQPRTDPMSLSEITARIRRAEEAAGRPEGSVALVAISKKQPDERVDAVLGEGHRLFGENRVQEAQQRWPERAAAHAGLELHLVGPLQSNKVRQAFGLFQAIHSLDRPKLAEAMARIAQETGACPEAFVQVNTGEEPQKAGVMPLEADGFVQRCRELDLPVTGLMCIPPVEEEPSLHFALLAKIANRNGLEKLSMGMSGDFEAAIELGATHVRVGSGVFGERPE